VFLPVTGPYGGSVWKFIRRGWDNVAKYLRFEVGDGSHICFWHDLWCGDKPLKLCYPALYCIVLRVLLMLGWWIICLW